MKEKKLFQPIYLFFGLLLAIAFVHCDDEPPVIEPPEPPIVIVPDFTDLNYRIGYWLNEGNLDTMQFVNDSIYIARGNFPSQIYEYYVEADTFYFRGQSLQLDYWFQRHFIFDEANKTVSFLTESSDPSLLPSYVPYKKIW
jgi:hypothetical protein